MKRVVLIFILVAICKRGLSQHTIPLRNLWAEPHVHVLFDGYVVSFTVKDINRAIQILNEAGDTSWGVTSDLDTGKEYTVELYAGYNTEYRERLQALLQKGVGAYLLSVGHAEIQNHKGRKLKDVTIDIQHFETDEDVLDVKFNDIKTGKLLFNGILPNNLYGKDIGIE